MNSTLESHLVRIFVNYNSRLLCLFLNLVFAVTSLNSFANYQISSDIPSNKAINIQLTPSESSYLSEHKQINVSVKSGWMPIEFKLESEMHRGISLDYLSHITKLTGLSFKLYNESNNSDFEKIHLISSVNENFKKEGFHLVKQPFLTIPYAIYVNQLITRSNKFNNMESLSHYRIAVYKNGSLAKKIRDNYPTIKLTYVEIADDAFELLKEGVVDAYIGNEVVIDYHIEFHRLKYAVKSGLTPFSSDVFMAVSDSESVLESILDKTLSEIGQNNPDIMNYWKYKTTNNEKPLKILLAFVSLISILGLFIYRKKVLEKEEKNQQRIWYQANYDLLTDLPNRYLLEAEFKALLSRLHDSTEKVVVLSINIDNFRLINDASGRMFGDLVLKEVASRIKINLNNSDILARVGSDEFVVIKINCSSTSNIKTICQNILNSVNAPLAIEERTFFITVSIGISIFPDDGHNYLKLLRNADQALDVAKRTGKNKLQYFEYTIQQKLDNKISLTNDLRTAITENELELYYQPIFSAKNGNIPKAEALIRWNHPIRGMIRPDEFISIAEESGLILELGNWIFNQVLKDIRTINTDFDSNFQIGINVSPLQFAQPKYLFSFLEELSNLRIPTKNICMEITEGLLLDPSIKVIETIRLIKELGVSLSLDDFGTGYSSLAYLKKFDIDFIKIDKAFIQNIESDNYDLVLCESIIHMAHRLGIKLIAEGIENENQKNVLTDINCDYLQGFLFAKPQPLNQLIAYILHSSNEQ